MKTNRMVYSELYSVSCLNSKLESYLGAKNNTVFKSCITILKFVDNKFVKKTGRYLYSIHVLNLVSYIIL